MIIPIRCFTCGNVLASKYKTYVETVRRNKNTPLIISSENISDPTILETIEKKTLDKLGLKRYCCRRHMITQVDIINYL